MMHIEFLTEDISSKTAMGIIAPKLLGNDVTFRIHPYKGIGRIPKGLLSKTEAKKRILLDQLPRLLRGYGNNPDYKVVVVICDLDDKDKQNFLSELQQLLDSCKPKPKTTLFCLAIEEFEAWYLGDLIAVKKAYPKAKSNILNSYKNDSICGTWELLADATYSGGSGVLSKKGWQAVGEQKTIWAKTISPYMSVDDNLSPSFMEMRVTLRKVMEQTV